MERGWEWTVVGRRGKFKEVVNTMAKGFWMEGNLDGLEQDSDMKKFVWVEIEQLHCGMAENFGMWCSTESESFGQSFTWY